MAGSRDDPGNVRARDDDVQQDVDAGYDANGYLNARADPWASRRRTPTTSRDARPPRSCRAGPQGPRAPSSPCSTETTNHVRDPPERRRPRLHLYTGQTLWPPTPRRASGAVPGDTEDPYDRDGRIQLETRPDGSTISYAYDSAGRLTTTSYPQGVITQTYSPTTGQLTAIESSTGESLTFAYDGFLNKGTTWSGTVAGSLVFGYDATFRMTSQSVNGTALSFGYDNDNLMTTAGAETISRDPQNGRVTGTTLGAISDAYTYDANGQLASYVAKDGGTTLYAETINTRDGDGRITERTETVGERHARLELRVRHGRTADRGDRGRDGGVEYLVRRGRQPDDVHERERDGERDV